MRAPANEIFSGRAWKKFSYLFLEKAVRAETAPHAFFFGNSHKKALWWAGWGRPGAFSLLSLQPSEPRGCGGTGEIAGEAQVKASAGEGPGGRLGPSPAEIACGMGGSEEAPTVFTKEKKKD